MKLVRPPKGSKRKDSLSKEEIEILRERDRKYHEVRKDKPSYKEYTCNRALGLFKDDPQLLSIAKEYVS
jgi:hypothetical protein